MTLPRSVAEVLGKHVTLEVESIDRMYLNAYVPLLQSERGVASFFRFHRGHQFASSALMNPMTVVFRLLARGFSNRDLRAHLAPLLGLAPSSMTQGRMTYDLRRLRLHGLIDRIPTTHRYRVTDFGFRTAFLFTRTYGRVLRPALAEVLAPEPPASGRLRADFDRLDTAIGRFLEEAHLAA
jgi:hypothetical protein